MGIQTYLRRADKHLGKTQIEGSILTAPVMIIGDGTNSTWGCNVDIGQEGVLDANGTIGVLPLYNVPIASGNNQLQYARPGNAVTLRKNSSGNWEITGFSKMKPGTFTIIKVTIPNVCSAFPVIEVDAPIQQGYTQVALSLGEFGTLRPFGELKLGAQAQYLNGELIGII